MTTLFTQLAATTCSYNGEPIDCDKVKPFIGLGIGIFFIIIAILIISFVFWLMMLIHAINHNSPDRTTWIAVLAVAFFTGFSFIAAIVYFAVERKKAEQYPKNGVPPASPTAPQYQTPPPQQPPDQTPRAPLE